MEKEKDKIQEEAEEEQDEEDLAKEEGEEADASAIQQPKKPAGGAFGKFMAEKRPDFQQQCPGQAVSVIMKLAGATWKALSDAEKAPYQTAFVAAQAKYATDFTAFIEAGGVKTKGAAALRTEKKKAKAGHESKVATPNRIRETTEDDKQVMAEAKRENMHMRLKALMENPNIADKQLDASVVFKALQDANGKVPAAKRTLLDKKAVQDASGNATAANEEGGDDAESPPAKKAKVAKASMPIDADTMAQAQKQNMHMKLKALMENPNIADKQLDASVVFKALQDGNGNVPAAKRTLLDAKAVQDASGNAAAANEEGGDDAALTPAKKAKVAKASMPIDADTMAQAQKQNMHMKLKGLMERPEVADKQLDASVVFKALQDANGRVPVAKRALFGEKGTEAAEGAGGAGANDGSCID